MQLVLHLIERQTDETKPKYFWLQNGPRYAEERNFS